jgi:hypothetical protein
MPAAPRHAKPKAPATRFKAPAVAAVALAGVAATLVSLHGGSAAHTSSSSTISGASEDALFTGGHVTAQIRRDVGRAQARSARRVARTHKLAQQRAAQRAAAQQAATQQPSPAPSSPPPNLAAGSDPAHSALGICIRNAEEGGSYAWGPGNGGGAYQFVIGTWETYGGAASEFGVAGPAYQDQIFNNAIAAGGASNWTAYDGC